MVVAYVRKNMATTPAEPDLSDSEKLKKFEKWACDECGVRKSTCTRGFDGPKLCNECAFGDDERGE